MTAQEKPNTQKSKVDILIEELDKIFIKNGFRKPVLVTKTGGGVYIPSQKRSIPKNTNEDTTTKETQSEELKNKNELNGRETPKSELKEKETPKSELNENEKPKLRKLTLEERMEIMSYPPYWQPSLEAAARRGVSPKEMYEKSKGLEAFT